MKVLLFLMFVLFVNAYSKDFTLDEACKIMVAYQLLLCSETPDTECYYTVKDSVFIRYGRYFKPETRSDLLRYCFKLCNKEIDVAPTLRKTYDDCMKGNYFSDWFLRNKIK